MTSIRVFIADDHAVLRAGLKLLIGAESDMTIVGEAADGNAAVLGAQATKPNVVLLDLSMPGPPAVQTIASLVLLKPSPRVLVLTMHDDESAMLRAMGAGAAGYIVKQAADVELLTAIRTVHGGRTFVDLTRPPQGSASGPRNVRVPLSQREREVLRLLAHGHTNQETADTLGVSVKTVETHRKRLSGKLGLKSRAQLFQMARELGLFEGEEGVAV